MVVARKGLHTPTISAVRQPQNKDQDDPEKMSGQFQDPWYFVWGGSVKELWCTPTAAVYNAAGASTKRDVRQNKNPQEDLHSFWFETRRSASAYHVDRKGLRVESILAGTTIMHNWGGSCSIYKKHRLVETHVSGIHCRSGFLSRLLWIY